MEDSAKPATSQLCRLRLVAGNRAAELALPTDVALVDLLPAILRHAGGDLADTGVEHEGWVLQRLGHAPLDEDRTVEELGLIDGQTVHLRPRSAAIPEIDFDDLVDGIAERALGRADRWTDRRSRWMLLGFGCVALLCALGVLTLGGAVAARTIAAAAVSVVLLLVATGLSRTGRDPVTATVLALAAVPFALLAGALLPATVAAPATAADALATATVFGAVTVALGLVGVADAGAVFVGSLTGLLVLAVAGVVFAATGAQSWQAAAVGLAVSLVLLGFVPTISFRLAGLNLPALPTSAEEFGLDTDPIPYREVVDGTATADRYMVALYAGTGLAQTLLLVTMAISGAGWPMIMAAVAALLLLLRSRHVDSTRQRVCLLAPAGVALAVDLVVLAAGLDVFARLWFGFAGALLLALASVVASTSLPGRRLRPYWGRAVDILETLSALALIPLLLAVLDVYAVVRGMAG